MMIKISADIDYQTLFFAALSTEDWEKLLEIWKQKPILDEMGSPGKDKSNDSLKGLKIVCSWICALIDINFKVQAK